MSESPSQHGFVLWNKWSIQSIIKTAFKNSYYDNYIYKYIKLTTQKPATKIIEKIKS
jgi:hypothetical protein